jgi:hypothetical protein
MAGLSTFRSRMLLLWGSRTFRRNCPRRAEINLNQQQQAQSLQQSATVDRPARHTSSGASGSRVRTHVQNDKTQGAWTQERVYYMTQEETRVAPDVVAGTL